MAAVSEHQDAELQAGNVAAAQKVRNEKKKSHSMPLSTSFRKMEITKQERKLVISTKQVIVVLHLHESELLVSPDKQSYVNMEILNGETQTVTNWAPHRRSD